MKDMVGFVKKITGLAETLGSEMSEGKLWAYEMALSEFSDSQVSAAIAMALKTCKFFPKPFELIELIEGKKEDQAALAWETLLDTMQHIGAYQSVFFEDGRIARAVKLLGGWQTVCSWKREELKFLRLDFAKIYCSLPADTAPESLDGISAINANASGYLDRIPKTLRIPCLSSATQIPIVAGKDRVERIRGPQQISEILEGANL